MPATGGRITCTPIHHQADAPCLASPGQLCDRAVLEQTTLFGNGLQMETKKAQVELTEGATLRARLEVAAQVDEFTGDHLALAIGVGGNHQLGGLAKQLFDDLELRGGGGLDLTASALGNNGQLLNGPALVLLVIRFG